MNKTHLLFTSSASQHRQIGVNGEPVIGAASAILQEIERRLSLRHRRLFAEPVENSDRSQIDWWTDAPGSFRPFEALSETEQQETLQEIRTLLEDVRRIADALKKSKVPDSMLVGQWLETATQSPAPMGLFRVGDQPVMTLWAHEADAVSSGNMAAPAQAVAGAGAVSPQMVIEAEATSGGTAQDAHFEEVKSSRERGWRWPFSWPWSWSWPWAWLPFAIPSWLRALFWILLLLLLLALLLRACSPSLPGFSLPGFGSGAEGSKETGTTKVGAANENPPAAGEKPSSGETPSGGSQQAPADQQTKKPGNALDGAARTAPNAPPNSAPGTQTIVVPGGSASGDAPSAESAAPTNVGTPSGGAPTDTPADKPIDTLGLAPGVLPGDSTTGAVPRTEVPRANVPGGTVVVPTPSGPSESMDEATRAVILSLEEERARERELRRRIAELENRLAAEQQACGNGICLPKTESRVTPRTDTTDPLRAIEGPDSIEPSPQVTTEEPATATAPPPQQPEQEAPPQQAPPQEAQTGEVAETDQMICTPDRKSWEAPEIVIIMDTSGSMGIDRSYPSSEIDPVLQRAQAGDLASVAQIGAMQAEAENRRINYVQEGLTSIIQRLPLDIDIGFIDFGTCDSIVNHKFYSSGQRDELLSIINNTEPRQGTPLARALERGGSIIKGRAEGEKGVIVLVSDGYGTCGGDVCAVARNLAAQKPGVTINVVTLGAKSAAQCAADLTGGRVVDVENIGLLQALSDASEEKLASAACR